jgi:ribosomal-protein-alanine N-acetyltransferase
VTIFATERLAFRRLVPGDLDDLHALYRDPEVRRWFPEGTLTRDQTREELEWFLDGHPRNPALGLWATIEMVTGAFVGRCGLLVWDIEGREEIEIAYMIAKSHWRRGLGAEAARGLVQHGFETLGLARLIALIDPGNEASMRTAAAAGLAFERRTMLNDFDTVIYAIAREAPPGEAAAAGAAARRETCR